jgi:hypothetical protein
LPTTPSTAPSRVAISTRWPTRITGSQPPTPVNQRKPSSSMWWTIRPISSMWPTIATSGLGGAGDARDGRADRVVGDLGEGGSRLAEHRGGGLLVAGGAWRDEQPSEDVREGHGRAMLSGCQAALPELAQRAVALGQSIQLHALEHLGRLGELDVAVVDDLDVVAPRVAELETAAAGHRHARIRERGADCVAVLDDEAEVAAVVGLLRAPSASAMNWSPMSTKAMPGSRPRSRISNRAL